MKGNCARRRENKKESLCSAKAYCEMMNRTVARETALICIFSLEFNDRKDSVSQEQLEERLSGEALARLGEQTGLYEGVPEERYAAYIRSLAAGVMEKQEELDGYISRYASGWSVRRISRMCRALLHLALYEIVYLEDVPASVAINEAVELTKKYENEDMPAFINGVLGGFVRGEKIEK